MAWTSGPEAPARAATLPWHRRVVALVAASHAAPTVAVTLFAGAYAAGTGLPAGRVLGVGVAVLAGQLSVGWSNDWVDAARDLATGRTDKPVAAGAVSTATVRAAALTALAVCVVASFALGWRAGTVHLVAVAAAWGYNLGLKSTLASPAPYALAFGLLPSVATLAAVPDPRWAPWWTTLAAALLGVGAHLLNVLPDLDDDAATGIRGLPHRLGRGPSLVGAVACLLGATALVALAAPDLPTGLAPVGLAGAGLLAAVACWAALRRQRSRVPFTAAIGVAALAVLLLVAGAGPT